MKRADLGKWYDVAFCMKMVKQDGYTLPFVKDQTEAVCLEAVKWDGCSLLFVKDQTEAVCLKAVKRDGCALLFVTREFWPFFADMLED